VRYLALCCDYDGTLAEKGTVSPATVDALQRLRASGRRILLVTGRILAELQTVCSRLDLFDRVIVENGASLYDPATGEERLLSARPVELFIQTLRDRGVQPLSVGRVIVAAWQPQQTIVLNAIRDLGLELQVIFNKDAVMVLPTGVNKASGLAVALRALNVSPRNIVGIGDAENDYAFLASCEVAVAVDNALPLLKGAADFVTHNARGAGVVELIEELLMDDLRARRARLGRHRVLLGLEDESRKDILLHPQDFNALLVPTSGADKAAVVTGLLERLLAQGYNFCVIDPEGGSARLEGTLTLGTATQAPTLDEAQQLLNTYDTNFVVNLSAVKPEDRPNTFVALLRRIQESRLRNGRPHLLIIDEIHQIVPANQECSDCDPLAQLEGVLRISTKPGLIAQAALSGVTCALAIGKDAQNALRKQQLNCTLVRHCTGRSRRHRHRGK
jgi:HAD superfamily hydrolase (TIGR01484 family)